GAVHVPQLIMPPQPSESGPQVSPAGQLLSGVQPHSLAVPPPPQVCGDVQVPQLMVVQPYGAVPQFWPPAHVGAGPVLVHLFCALLQSSCTYQVRPETVIVSPALPLSQMSPISPHLLKLSPQP